MPEPEAVIELGSGTGEKTRHILSAFSLASKARYIPIDVSPKALARCERDLADVAEVQPLAQSYLDGMASAVCQARRRAVAGAVSGQHDRKFRTWVRGGISTGACGAHCALATRF